MPPMKTENNDHNGSYHANGCNGYTRDSTELPGFVKMPLEERAAVLIRKGKVLELRHFSNIRASLYQIDSMYIEMWYDKGKVEITRIDSVDENFVKKYYPEQHRRLSAK